MSNNAPCKLNACIILKHQNKKSYYINKFVYNICSGIFYLYLFNCFTLKYK